ncbi:heme o synthase [Mesorhizobium sp. YM1C-6-2]|uniref:heme o synthase n=1 Tax=Mesorhizobium sp. YM1C-6-2 TaxID=1827501 RepID=UPI000EF1C6C8|nr:heme o synthase [Mesorhizobium sp. YM1C-6-2]RLP25179.1 protoheme IX farnesyltransferase [Mesorhizobium sp. YM1C-6-2]
MTFLDKTVLDEAVLSEATAGDYLELLKPRVMSLVVFTAFVGMVAAPVTLNPFVAIVAILSIAIGAGASGALNMWYDADIDAVMSRTASRPVPAGRILPQQALAFGLVLSALSVMTLGVFVNWVAGAGLAFTIFFYAVVYTMWLKRWTPQNIVIGGAAGSFPPMIGWAAATGSISLESVILFLIIFLWTPPHFWALALFKSGDYARAGVPMMPNVAGEASTKRQIFAYSVVLAVVGVLPWVLDYAGAAYGVAAAALGLGFVWYAWAVLMMPADDRAMRPAKALFGYSLLYLFAIFAIYLADSVVERIVTGAAA